jgi:hypothetical protein
MGRECVEFSVATTNVDARPANGDLRWSVRQPLCGFTVAREVKEVKDRRSIPYAAFLSTRDHTHFGDGNVAGSFR